MRDEVRHFPAERLREFSGRVRAGTTGRFVFVPGSLPDEVDGPGVRGQGSGIRSQQESPRHRVGLVGRSFLTPDL